ncbi:MAG TPA: hypothetical protein VMV69_04565 [Pirellulales bacterium]|nr:hypothetical protein [Pirellulales bacterium]
MDENPYESPQFPGTPLTEPKPGTWHPFTWSVIGFAGGVVVAAPFILSVDMPTKIQGGMMYGGIIGAICGLAYGIQRRWGVASQNTLPHAPD